MAYNCKDSENVINFQSFSQHINKASQNKPFSKAIILVV